MNGVKSNCKVEIIYRLKMVKGLNKFGEHSYKNHVYLHAYKLSEFVLVWGVTLKTECYVLAI